MTTKIKKSKEKGVKYDVKVTLSLHYCIRQVMTDEIKVSKIRVKWKTDSKTQGMTWEAIAKPKNKRQIEYNFNGYITSFSTVGEWFEKENRFSDRTITFSLYEMVGKSIKKVGKAVYNLGELIKIGDNKSVAKTLTFKYYKKNIFGVRTKRTIDPEKESKKKASKEVKTHGTTTSTKTNDVTHSGSKADHPSTSIETAKTLKHSNNHKGKKDIVTLSFSIITYCEKESKIEQKMLSSDILTELLEDEKFNQFPPSLELDLESEKEKKTKNDNVNDNDQGEAKPIVILKKILETKEVQTEEDIREEVLRKEIIWQKKEKKYKEQINSFKEQLVDIHFKHKKYKYENYKNVKLKEQGLIEHQRELDKEIIFLKEKNAVNFSIINDLKERNRDTIKELNDVNTKYIGLQDSLGLKKTQMKGLMIKLFKLTKKLKKIQQESQEQEKLKNLSSSSSSSVHRDTKNNQKKQHSSFSLLFTCSILYGSLFFVFSLILLNSYHPNRFHFDSFLPKSIFYLFLLFISLIISFLGFEIGKNMNFTTSFFKLHEKLSLEFGKKAFFQAFFYGIFFGFSKIILNKLAILIGLKSASFYSPNIEIFPLIVGIAESWVEEILLRLFFFQFTKGVSVGLFQKYKKVKTYKNHIFVLSLVMNGLATGLFQCLLKSFSFLNFFFGCAFGITSSYMYSLVELIETSILTHVIAAGIVASFSK